MDTPWGRRPVCRVGESSPVWAWQADSLPHGLIRGSFNIDEWDKRDAPVCHGLPGMPVPSRPDCLQDEVGIGE